MDGDEETPSPAPTIVEPTLFFDLCYPFLDVPELQTLERVCKLPNAAHYWRSLWECKYSKLVPNAEVRHYLQSREVGFRGAIRIVRFLCAEVHRQEIGVWGSCSESEEPDHRRGLPYARYLLRTAISQRWEEDVVAVLREEKPQAKLKCPITIEDERLDVSLLLAIVSSQHSSVHALRTRIWSLAGFLVEAALDALCNEEDEHGIFYVPADNTGGVGWTDARLLIQAKHEEIGIDLPSESARKEEVLSAAASDFVRKRECVQRCAAEEGIQFFLLWFSQFGEAARLIAARLLEHEDRSNASQLAPAEREANAREAGKIKKLLMPDAVMELISLADPSEFLSSYFIGPDVIGLEDDPLPEPPPDFGFVSEGGLWCLCFAAKPCSQAIAALLRVCARRPNHVAIGKLLVDCFFSPRGETETNGPLTPGPLDINALDSVHGVGHTQLSAFPLLIAAKEGHTDFVSMLVASGADVNLKDQNGRTALMVAVIYKRFETVQAMLRLPTIDLTVATNFRFNCLHYACLSADAACVREVLQAAEDKSKPRDDEMEQAQAPHGIKKKLVELLECRDTAKRNTPLLELVSMLASGGGGEEGVPARSPSNGEEERERYGRPVAMADWYGDECVYDQSWRRLTPHDPVRENEIKKSVAHVLLFAARCRGSSAALSSVLLTRNANGQDVVGICADKKRNDFLLFVRNFLRGLETTSSVRNARAVFEKRLQDAGFAVD